MGIKEPVPKDARFELSVSEAQALGRPPGRQEFLLTAEESDILHNKQVKDKLDYAHRTRPIRDKITKGHKIDALEKEVNKFLGEE